VIWSEGAIYIIGFENGINLLKPLLKKGGYLTATKIGWMKADAGAGQNFLEQRISGNEGYVFLCDAD
jgi:hypothetical protein